MFFFILFIVQRRVWINDFNKFVLLILLILRVFLFELGMDFFEDEEMWKMLQIQLGKMEILFIFSNKFEVLEDDQVDV